MNEEEGTTSSFEVYKSPAERLKQLIIKLLEESFNHYSKSYNNKEEKFAFIIKTKCLSDLILRWTGRNAKVELLQWSKQLNNEIKALRETKDMSITKDKIEDKILELKFIFAEEVAKHNTIIIQNSPIIDTEVEGELDITDEDMLGIVRLREKRKDDGKLEFKH